MAAIREAAMSLTLLSLASPAAAQFSVSDLNGTWFMRGLVVGATVDNGAAFANGAAFPPQPAINDAGAVLFPTFLRTETPAVFKADGELTEVANGSLLDADFQVRPSSLNGPGQASFIALGNTGVQRVLTQDALGQLVTTATTESGVYANLSQGDNSPAINDAGMVAFWAGLPAGSSGIFTEPIPAAGKVIQTGDPLFGSTVVEISLGGLNNRGEITFRARLLNGRQVNGVATPPGS